mgnify:CR=1 FL=1
MTNLFSNAIKYSAPETPITINFEINKAFLAMSISNVTTDLVEADLQHFTEHFWRKDATRTGGKNSGLGLLWCPCYAMFWTLL